MKLEQQVVSLEIAKKLKELGVKQESLFWWGEYAHDPKPIHSDPFKVCTSLTTSDRVNFESIASAFTVAELGEMLPSHVISAKLGAQWKWSAAKWSNGDVLSGKDIGTFYASTEANVRGRMLIYLLENKLI